MNDIKIAIVSAWYNEELLAPFFLKHYSYADEIHIILDAATNDTTEAILAGDERVVIHRMEYPEDGLDWTLKQAKVDEIYGQIEADWVFAIDADELLFKRGEADIKAFLARQTGDIMWARLYQVYRHEADKDLDPNLSPLEQRRHGIPLEPEGIQYMPDRAYFKPVVIRAKLNPQWDCGCHNYSNRQLTECTDRMDGAHWHMADQTIAIRRRLQTKARQGKKNISLGLGVQNHSITEGEIIYECWLHRNDPVVIFPDKDPVVSIIIPCFNNLEYTQQCLESIEAYTPEPHEIIFVDNGSTDDTFGYLQSRMLKNANYKVIKNDTNEGFVKACNQGILAASGNYVLLLNNDTVVSKEWLKGLLDCIKSSNDIAIVGPRSNYVSGPQLVSDDTVGYDSLFKYHQFAENYRKAYRGCYIPYWRIVGFCMLIKKSVIDEIGLLDERFSPGNFEDDDLCLRACLAGYRNVICSDVFVHHHGSQTCKDMDFAGILDANKKKFEEKWASLSRTISACMIVKDEERYIEQCINNIYPIVDEIILVDTGSKDRTKEIAAKAGKDKIRIYDFEWCDDYSAARNYANSKATMAYILSIDADEVITGLDKNKLLPYYTYRITTRNYTTNPYFNGITWNDGKYAEEAGHGWFPSTKIRIWPNDKRICFEYPVHEVVENSVYYLGCGIMESKDIVVHHYGRLEETYDEEHAEKYYRLLQKQFRAGKNDLRSIEQLAVQAQGLKLYDDAIKFWFDVIKIDPNGNLAPMNLCHCYAEKGDWHEAHKWAKLAYERDTNNRDACMNLALCEYHVGDDRLSEKICRDLLKKQPYNPLPNGLLNAIQKRRRQTTGGNNYEYKPLQ